jgi:hypothetical protein
MMLSIRGGEGHANVERYNGRFRSGTQDSVREEAFETGLMMLVEDRSCHTFLSAGVKTRLE